MKKLTAKKLICLFAAILMCACLLVLASCNKEDEPTSTTDTETTESPAKAGFPVVKDGVAARIVYANSEEEELFERANDIAASIKKFTGVVAEVDDDILSGAQKEYDDTRHDDCCIYR